MNSKKSLPQLRTNTKRVLTDLNSRPDFGKGIIYKVEWGFRLDKSSSYKGRGQYVGLTSNSISDRLRQHIKAASSLGYDGKLVTSNAKTKESQKSPRMFYLALRVAMGLTNDTNIEFNKDYRVIKAIKHVNLFDLAYEEIKEIGGKIVGTNYSRYEDYVRSGAVTGSNANNPAPFNETLGGERNKINSGYASHKEQVMAALLFMKEGRGSTEPMRSIVGIGKEKKDKDGNMVRNTVAQDVRAVFDYFKKAPGYEALNGSSPTIKTIPGIMAELGVGELIGENLIVSSDKTRMVNVLLRFGETKAMNLDRADAKNAVQAILSRSGSIPEKLNVSVTSVSKKSAQKLADLIKNSDFLKSINVTRAAFILQARIRKTNKNFNLVDELYKDLVNNPEVTFEKLLTNPEFKKAYNLDQDKRKKERMDRKRHQQK